MPVLSKATHSASEPPATTNEGLDGSKGDPDEAEGVEPRQVAEESPAYASSTREHPGPAAKRRGELCPLFSWVGEFEGDRVAALRAAVVGWMRARCPEPLVDDLPSAEAAGVSIISDASDDGVLWAARFDNFASGETLWRVETVLARASATTFAAVRMVAIQPPSSTVPLKPSIPQLVRILAEMGARDGGVPLGTVIHARSTEDGQLLLRHLLNPARQQPVLVVTRRREETSPIDVPAPVHGSVTTIELSGDAMQVLIDELGRQHAVFGGAWRLYRPNFKGVDDNAFTSPLLMFDEKSARSLGARLVQLIALATRDRVGDEDAIPSFVGARQLIREARARTRPADDAVSASTLRAVEEDLETWRKNAQAALRERDTATAQCESLRAEIQRLKSQTEVLRLALAQVRADRGRTSVEYPESFDDLEAWCAEHLGDNVVLSGKAIKAAQASLASPDTVRQAYQSLHLLAQEYMDMKMGGGETARKAFEARCQELRVEVGPVGAALRNHRYRSEYQTVLDGRTYQLDMHVSGSSSFNPSKVLRIYFTMDDAEARIVVGHLPGHLTNSLT